MKTTFDAVDIVFDQLQGSVELTNYTISGSIYKFNSRPANSELEDISINSLSISNSHIQQVVVNVNIHVPDVKMKGAESAYPVANSMRFKDILTKVVEILNGANGTWWKDGNLWIENISQPIQQEKIQQHYVNVRVQMRLRGNHKQ